MLETHATGSLRSKNSAPLCNYTSTETLAQNIWKFDLDLLTWGTNWSLVQTRWTILVQRATDAEAAQTVATRSRQRATHQAADSQAAQTRRRRRATHG